MSRSRPDALPCGVPSVDALAKGLSGGGAANQQHWDAFASARDAVPQSAADQTRWLARTIETEIIPRLMLAHRQGPVGATQLALPLGAGAEQQAAPTADQVQEFAQLALAGQAEPTLAYVERLRQASMPLDAIYLQLLAPAARHLGALWEADLCSFAEVTLGLWRLQQVMHELGPTFTQSQPPSQALAAPPRRAILVPVPGSQHTLGLFMVAEFFRRAGWDVWGDAMASAKDIVAAARDEWFDMIGISVGSETHFAELASVILHVRKASRNRGLLVIIGGPIVASTPGLVARVGADASAEDAPQAVRQAESLLSCRSATR